MTYWVVKIQSANCKSCFVKFDHIYTWTELGIEYPLVYVDIDNLTCSQLFWTLILIALYPTGK